MYTQQALTTFKSGILEPYCTHLLNVNQTNLEAALHECRKFDNERAQISFIHFMRNRGKPNNNNNMPNKKQSIYHDITILRVPLILTLAFCQELLKIFVNQLKIQQHNFLVDQ